MMPRPPLPEANAPSKVRRRLGHLRLLWEERYPLALLALASLVSYFLYSSQWANIVDAATDLTREISAKGRDQPAVTAVIVRFLAQDARHDWFRELLLHMSVAFFISFIVIVVVEIYSRKKLRSEVQRQRRRIAKDVWEALFERSLPKQIVRELEYIAEQNIVKEQCRYTITFSRHKGISEDQIIIKREVYFRAKNIRRQPSIYEMTSSIDGALEGEIEEEGIPTKLPRHIELQVDGKKEKLKDVLDKGNERTLRYRRMLGPSEAITVSMTGEELMPDRGENLYTQIIPAIGLTVILHNDAKDIEVEFLRLNHPNASQVSKGIDGVHRYDGAILPGQGFVVRWSPHHRASSADSANAREQPANAQAIPRLVQAEGSQNPTQ